MHQRKRPFAEMAWRRPWRQYKGRSGDGEGISYISQAGEGKCRHAAGRGNKLHGPIAQRAVIETRRKTAQREALRRKRQGKTGRMSASCTSLSIGREPMLARFKEPRITICITRK